MTNIEKVVAGITIAGALIGVGVSWNALNNRIDKIDDKMAKIEKVIGSAACNAILPRQIEAIEKNHKEAREHLEALSRQYECGPRQAKMPSPFSDAWPDAMMNASASNLGAQLNEVDVLLNESNASDAPR